LTEGTVKARLTKNPKEVNHAPKTEKMASMGVSGKKKTFPPQGTCSVKKLAPGPI